MSRRLIFTDRARNDLRQIGEYIGCDSPTNAARFVAKLKGACERLAVSPGIGKLRPDLTPEAGAFRLPTT